MSTKLKLYVGRKMLDILSNTSSITATHLKSFMEVEKAKSDNTKVEMSISLNALESKLGVSNVNKILKIQPDEIIQNIQYIGDRADKRLCFQINKTIFMKEIIEHCTYPELNPQKKKIVVEFSSPNVAKPFHVGHLRSTIIGNFIANLNDYLNNNVVKINYLGDWGTQFGFIKVGVDKLNRSQDEIKANPLQVLFESYVHANLLAQNDPSILEKAKEEFSKLEKGSKEEINSWKTYMQYTIGELESMYSRIGVKFDHYNYESMYSAKDIQNVLDTMNKNNVLSVLPDGKQVAKLANRNVSVVKSDGSTLYLTRDIAAAIDRFEKYQFDKMYYVVENGQNDHFNALTGILNQMNLSWVHRIQHVKFGRIKGMSTRRGNVVFLKDILNEANDLMRQRQIESPTTKVPITDAATSDILGISCVIINDLKQRRQKDYEFSWDRVLQVQGDSGIKLQYTHCRLHSLQKNSGAVAANECFPELLTEPEAIALVREMGRFQDVLYKADDQLEACILVTYLFQLCNCINKALKTLKIKGQDPVLGSQRLLLFNKAREVLRQGMVILGLKPLDEM